jgi:hypothetical protein
MLDRGDVMRFIQVRRDLSEIPGDAPAASVPPAAAGSGPRAEHGG